MSLSDSEGAVSARSGRQDGGASTAASLDRPRSGDASGDELKQTASGVPSATEEAERRSFATGEARSKAEADAKKARFTAEHREAALAAHDQATPVASGESAHATPGGPTGAPPKGTPTAAREFITVTGARQNNLANFSLAIPKHTLTVFTGVSGSGKSSLVFSTIAAEAQRLINETYPAFVQGFMGSQERPDVDHLDGLTATIIVDQESMGANPRSTLGTATDVDAKLRLLFSRAGEPHIGGPKAFSFNVPSASGAGSVVVKKNGREVREKRSFQVVGGQCPHCTGTGTVSDINIDGLIDRSKSLEQGAFDGIPGMKVGQWAYRQFAESGFFPVDKPVKHFTKRQLEDLLYKAPTKVKFAGFNATYEGLIPKLQKTIFAKEPEDMQPAVRALAERAVTFGVCPECEGTRLTAEARSVRIGSGTHARSIVDLSAMQITELLAWMRAYENPEYAPLVQGIIESLESFVAVGLGYLALNRPASTLSGGESQRAKMVRHLGSPLTDVTYVFDEPTTGLHPHDVGRVNSLLLELRDKGNTVLVVEHEPLTIAIADHVVNLGPGAGRQGGEVCFEGSVAELRSSGTLTGDHLDNRPALRAATRKPKGAIEIRGASANNLRSVDVDIPRGVLVAVTGVAGSGKSSLIHECMPREVGAEYLDQTQIKGSVRSNPATYTGMLDHVRKAFAKANGVKPALFSANSEGACPACKGTGVIVTQLVTMSTVTSVCDLCGGNRFDAEVLQYTLGGRSIADVFAMSASEAAEFLVPHSKPAARIATHMVDSGIGYLTLGQALSSLSGGERQRLKLAIALGGKSDVLVLDEPTTGLHMADVEALLQLLDGLVDAGTSVIVIEHDLQVIAHADHVIDMGPGAGHDGGTVVFEGTPAALAEEAGTLTGKYLAESLSAAVKAPAQ